MEQLNYRSGVWINPRQVWPLVQVAVMACQSEVPQIIAATVLARDDVFDVED